MIPCRHPGGTKPTRRGVPEWRSIWFWRSFIGRMPIDTSCAFPDLEPVEAINGSALEVPFCLLDQTFVGALGQELDAGNAAASHQVASHRFGRSLSALTIDGRCKK